MKKCHIIIISVAISSSSFAQRDTISLNDNWLFAINKNSQMQSHLSFADAKNVNLPHTWW